VCVISYFLNIVLSMDRGGGAAAGFEAEICRPVPPPPVTTPATLIWNLKLRGCQLKNGGVLIFLLWKRSKVIIVGRLKMVYSF
jgi:hypothetical protein